MPRKAYARHKKSGKRQENIIRAAQACFAEFGFANTTMEDIRLRSGASNGSIYHHFASKEGLAAAIYVEVMTDYQQRILTALEQNPGARAGIKAVVESHLDWVNEKPEQAKYLMEMRHADFMAAAEDALAEANQDFAMGFVTWIKPNLKSGRLRRVDPIMFISLVLGPCQEYVRNWLGGDTVTDLTGAKEELARAAWLVLRGDEERE
jgi:AcrR family transcriptional regulator